MGDVIELKGQRVIALGERDGVSGPAIAAVVEASGGIVILSATECFV
jgi:glycine reductase